MRQNVILKANRENTLSFNLCFIFLMIEW